MIEIRRPLPTEWKQIAEVYRVSDQDVSWSTANALEEAALGTDDDDGYFVLAAVDGERVVGWLWGTVNCSIVPELNPATIEGPHAFVAAIDVLPERRRAGVGRALMDAFVSEAHANGARIVALRADMGDGLEARSAFFAAIGMLPVDENGFWLRVGV